LVAHAEKGAELLAQLTIEFRGKFKMAASINLHRIVFLFILLMRRRRRRMRAACRTIWSRTWIQRRQRRGIFVNLLRELEEEDPEKFRQYHRFDINSYRKILRMVEPYIKKKDTVMRVSISPGERLSVTLRFLATGEPKYKTKRYCPFWIIYKKLAMSMSNIFFRRVIPKFIISVQDRRTNCIKYYQ
jgi:hypothetical protein